VSDAVSTTLIQSQLPPDAQILLFSATFPQRVQDYSMKMCPAANEIKLKKEELSVDAIQQLYMDCADEDAKFDVLVELYELMTIGQSIIFCRVS
jgi:ATP-dependent RNA helicase DDX19/DBP5